MKHIADLYPEASVVRVVMENINTHKIYALYVAFPAASVWFGKKIGISLFMPCGYTPKHGSWLNIAEIELAVLSNMCLSRRIPDKDTLRREVEANVKERNLKAMPVNWHFTTQDARLKLARLYPCVSSWLTTGCDKNRRLADRHGAGRGRWWWHFSCRGYAANDCGESGFAYGDLFAAVL